MTAIGDVLRRARDATLFSGAAWAFGTADGELERGTIGTLSWDGPPVAQDTWWDLASVTKPVVGLVIMSLVDSGLLVLDDTVATFLPDFADSDKAGLTVAELMTHTSGVPGQVPLYRWCRTRGELLRGIRDLPLAFAPGTDVVYSSQGFVLLGLIAEAVTGHTLDQLVRELVTVPAGMPSTGFGLPAALRGRAAATEDCPWRGGLVQGTVHDENAVVLGGVCGHAGLFGPLDDLAALALALSRGGLGEHGRVLSSAGLRAMTRPATDHLPLRRSLAWQGRDRTACPYGDLVGERAFGHTGFTGTSLLVDPESGGYVVLLTNRVHPTRDRVGFVRVRQAVHNLALGTI